MIYSELKLFVLLSVNSTSNRFYLDYNATSPFSKSVVTFLREGVLLFGNPSSLHYVGKYANRHMREVREFLKKTFDIGDLFQIIFHSGATEGINSFFRSVLWQCQVSGDRPLFLFSRADHSASYNQLELIQSLGFPVRFFDVDKSGTFQLEQILSLIDEYGDKHAAYPAVINYLYVNNETGRIWDLEFARVIKEKTGALVHVDAVQSVGKLPEWNMIDQSLDAYTYSAHKFGAMKGVGFTLLNYKLKLPPFLYGGGQQYGMRSGTENVLGIYSVKLALEDLFQTQEFSVVENRFHKLLEALREIKHIELLEYKSYKNWTCNTVVVSCPSKDSNTLVTAFDISGFAISSGAACSSGITRPNRVLLNMGYEESFAKSAIRISWDPLLYSDEEWNQICSKICQILKRFH